MRYDLFIGRNAEFRIDQPFVGHMVDHIEVVVGIDRAYPLVHARPFANVLRRQARSVKRLVDIGGNGAGFVDGEIAVPQDRDAIEWM